MRREPKNKIPGSAARWAAWNPPLCGRWHCGCTVLWKRVVNNLNSSLTGGKGCVCVCRWWGGGGLRKEAYLLTVQQDGQSDHGAPLEWQVALQARLVEVQGEGGGVGGGGGPRNAAGGHPIRLGGPQLQHTLPPSAVCVGLPALLLGRQRNCGDWQLPCRYSALLLFRFLGCSCRPSASLLCCQCGCSDGQLPCRETALPRLRKFGGGVGFF